MPAAIGSLAKLGMGASSPVSEAYEFLNESLRVRKSILDTSGIRGTRSHAKERTRAGTSVVSGTIVMQPTPEELANLLPRILGAAASGTTYDLAETLPSFYVTVDRVSKVFTYDGCKIVRAVFRSSEGQPLELAIEIEGTSEAIGNAGTFPSISPGLTAPYVFTDGVLTLQSSARSMKRIELTIENVADEKRFLNSTTRAEIPIIDRNVTLRCTVPYTSAETALHDQSAAGAAGSVVFTNGGYSTTFTFANLQFPAASPIVNSRGEIVLELEGTARKSGSTNELVVTHDSTP